MYEDAGAYRYVNLAYVFDRLRSGKKEENKEPHEATHMFPEVAGIMDIAGPAAQSALETLIDISRKYRTAMEARPQESTASPYDLSQEEADQIRDALETLWTAFPKLDPRFLEGYSYVMEAEPTVKSVFPRRVFDYVSCQDYKVGERMEQMLESGRPVPDHLVAVAEQYVENMQVFAEYAKPISEQALAFYLKQVYRFDEKANYRSYNEFDQSSQIAEHILDQLDAGTYSIKQAASMISSGAFDDLRGTRKWLQNDDERKEALRVAKSAEKYLDFATKVRSGKWFHEESCRIMRLAYSGPAKTEPAPSTLKP